MVAMKFAQVVKYWKLFEASQYFPTLRNVEKKAGDEDWRSHPCFGAPEREQNITVWSQDFHLYMTRFLECPWFE